jgi:hypothetical protein
MYVSFTVLSFARDRHECLVDLKGDCYCLFDYKQRAIFRQTLE